jgi:hypothetical protein
MKKIVSYFLLFAFSFLLFSCKKEAENRWNVEIKKSEPVKITDISAEFYNEKILFQNFKNDFGFFLSPQVSDATYEKKRNDALEKRVYKTALSLNNIPEIEKNLESLFAHIKFYFPQFQNPKVYIFSSATELYEEPILYVPDQKILFIDISAFMGEKSEFYEGIEHYYRREMTPANLIAKVSETIAADYVPATPDHNKFIDKIINYGKILTLQDAFLPKTKDQYKIGYTKDQQSWVISNEENIYNYFVENDLIFSDDNRLDERFLTKSPFSKFYTEIDQKSSPRVGAFIGWQICRKYLEEHPDVSLQKFLQLPATVIFNNSNYKPKN